MAIPGELTVVENADERRYEARVGSEVVGFLEYRLAQDGRMMLLHTEVDPSVEGEGVGSQLVAWVLDDIRRRGLGMVPYCPFVRAYVRRHPEYSDLAASR
jgi:predicted GNAT family acetyltransferase